MQHVLATTIQEPKDEKEATKQLQASTQSQLATVHALASNSSGGAGGGGGARKSNEPKVCHKLMLNKAALSGKEDYDYFDKWFIDMTDDFEILMPGAKKILPKSQRKAKRESPFKEFSLGALRLLPQPFLESNSQHSRRKQSDKLEPSSSH